MINSSEWPAYRLLICGWCRHSSFMVWKHRGMSFQDFWTQLAEHYEVPLDGQLMHNTTIASISLVGVDDGIFMQDHNLVTFTVE